MAYLFRIVALVLLGLVSHQAFASFPPSTSCTSQRPGNVPADGTMVGGCGELTPDGKGPITTVVTNNGLTCAAGPSCGAAGVQSVYNWASNGSGSCPANSSNIAGSCVCAAGYSDYNTNGVMSCKKDVDTTCEQSGLLFNTLGTDRETRVPGKLALGGTTTVCYVPPDSPPGAGGCKHEFTADFQYADDQGVWTTTGTSWAVTDAAQAGGSVGCTPGAPGVDPKPADKPEKNCERGYKGTVNGVDVCIDASSGKTNGVDINRITSTDGKAATIKSEVSCIGEKCTVTETRKLTNANGTAGATSTVTTNDVNRREYCAQNPKNPVCGAKEDKTGTTKGQGDQTGGPDGKEGGKGNSTGDGEGDGEDDGHSFGGTCEGGFTCEGDAIQCAIAQEQHRRSCELFVNKSDESDLYTEEKGKEGNRTKDLEANETIDMAGRIDQSSALGGGGGVQDLALTVAGHAVSLPLSQLNNPLAALGNLLVAVSFLLAFRIVGRG